MANPLAKIRGFMGKTQAWADTKCKLCDGSYARREASDDIRIKTLASTLESFGVSARIVVTMDNGEEIKLKLTEK